MFVDRKVVWEDVFGQTCSVYVCGQTGSVGVCLWADRW